MRALNISLATHDIVKLKSMITDPRSHVRLAAASDDAATDEIIGIALKDKSPDVRRAAAGNFWISEKMLEVALSNDAKSVISVAVQNIGVTPELIRKHWAKTNALLESKVTPADVIVDAWNTRGIGRGLLLDKPEVPVSILRTAMKENCYGVTVMAMAMRHKNADLSVFMLGLKCSYKVIQDLALARIKEYKNSGRKIKQ